MRNPRWCVFPFCLAASLLLTGCFGGYHSGSRGISFSDAMSASASGNSANLVSNGSYRESGYSHDGGVALAVAGAAEVSSIQADESDEVFILSFAVEEVIPIANDIRSISRFELIPLALQDEDNYGGFYIGGGTVQFRSGSFPDQAVTDSWLLDAGLIGRHYFTPPKTFLSPYLTGGIFGQILFWDYRTPLNLNGEIIRSDSIYGGGGFVGLGLAVARKEHFDIFAEARLGLSIYDEATLHGFYNDILESYGFVSVRAGISFKF